MDKKKFEKMAEMMKGCCSDEEGLAGCCSMMRDMMEFGEGKEAAENKDSEKPE